MGFCQAGGIESHLEQTKIAVIRWLEYEYSKDATQKDDLLLGLATEDEKPEQPEILALARQLRNMGLSYWEGGYAAQPCLLVQELQVCYNAEIEFKNNLLVNERLRLEWETRKDEQVH